MAGGDASSTPPAWRPRIAGALVVVACLLTFLGLLGGWLRLVALESDAWSAVSGSVLEKPAVRTQVAHTLVDRLFERADARLDVQEQMPSRLKPLIPPLMGLAQEAAYRNAERVLASPDFQKAWKQANHDAHEELMAIIDGRSPAVEQANGRVELDVRPLLELVATRVGVNPDVVDRIPDERAMIDLGLEQQLEQARRAVIAIKAAVLGIVLLALVLLVAALWLGRARRIVVTRWIANGWIVTGLSLLSLIAIGGEVLVRRVGGDDVGVRDALDSAWVVVTHGLALAGWAIIFLGLGIRLLLWVSAGSRGGRVGERVSRWSAAARDHHAAATAAWAVPLAIVLVFASSFVVDHVVLVVLVTALTASAIELARRRARIDAAGGA